MTCNLYTWKLKIGKTNEERLGSYIGLIQNKNITEPNNPNKLIAIQSRFWKKPYNGYCFFS